MAKLPKNISKKFISDLANDLSNHMKETYNRPIKSSKLLQAISQSCNFKNWNTLSAYLDTKSHISNDYSDDLLSLDDILNKAIHNKHKTIRIEPLDDKLLIYTNLAGMRINLKQHKFDKYNSIIDKLSKLSGLNILDHSSGLLEGCFNFLFDHRIVKIELTVIPSKFGIDICLEIFDPLTPFLTLDELNISDIDKWKKSLTHKTGICLIGGGFSSGAFTTLKSTIYEINSVSKKNISLICDKKSEFLYHSLNIDLYNKHDDTSDIVFIDDIKSKETVNYLMKVSKTKLVVATVHSNYLWGVLNRLRDLGGIEFSDFNGSLRSVLCQNLVLSTCYHCKANGCDNCYNGYYSVVPISHCEIFGNNFDFMKLKRDDFLDCVLNDAYLKLKNGDTTKEELARYYGKEFIEKIESTFY